MDLLGIGLLLLLTGQARGATHFLYQESNQRPRIVCERKSWHIDFNSDNEVNCNLQIKGKESSEESDEGTDACEEIEKYKDKSCSGKVQAKRCLTTESLKSNNGFFACGDKFTLQDIYPFKPSVENEYFILAFAKPDVLEPLPQIRKSSSININEGEPIILTCSFSISPGFSNSPYVVYWIKTGGEGSTCVYSYDFDLHGGIPYDTHCFLETSFRTRVSNTTSQDPRAKTHFHNLTINNGTHSDRGQYMCALNVKQTNSYWMVISNVTVIVNKKELTSQNMTPLSKAIFIPIYLVVALAIISIFVIGIYMKKKSRMAKVESDYTKKERHQSGDESIHPEICPYSVVGREFEPYSVVKLTGKPADHEGLGDQAKLPAEPYSTIKLNPLGSSVQDDTNLKHAEKPVDIETHVYDSINDTYSTCK